MHICVGEGDPYLTKPVRLSTLSSSEFAPATKFRAYSSAQICNVIYTFAPGQKPCHAVGVGEGGQGSPRLSTCPPLQSIESHNDRLQLITSHKIWRVRYQRALRRAGKDYTYRASSLWANPPEGNTLQSFAGYLTLIIPEARFSIMLRAVFALFGIAVFIHLTWKRAHPRLPPGPKPLPLVGNLRDLPSGKTPEYQHWLKFKDIYNPFTHLSVFGQSLIIIHDRDVAHELFEKVSTKTSGRPSFPMASKLCGYERFLSLHQYDNTFRQHRKLVHQQLGTRAATARFRDIQDEESRRFLLRVLDDPDNLFQHIKRYVDLSNYTLSLFSCVFSNTVALGRRVRSSCE